MDSDGFGALTLHEPDLVVMNSLAGQGGYFKADTDTAYHSFLLDHSGYFIVLIKAKEIISLGNDLDKVKILLPEKAIVEMLEKLKAQKEHNEKIAMFQKI